MATDNLCSCGHRYRLDDRNDETLSCQGIQVSQMTAMDASFVHLPDASHVRHTSRKPSSRGGSSSNTSLTAPEHNHSLLADSSSHTIRDSQSGFLGRYIHLKALEKAVHDPFDPGVRFCPTCLERLEQTIQADTYLIEREIQTYRDTIQEEELRCESWNRTFAAWDQMEADPEASQQDVEGITGGCAATVLERQTNAFRDEFQALQTAIEQQEQAIQNLQHVRRDQTTALQKLEQVQMALEEERNALEINAKTFDNTQDLLHRRLSRTMGEVDGLTSPHLRFTFLLFDLQVDCERGLRYPLINDLRLAYRPKGDVSWEEIQGAWSLAAQLLLLVATIFDFQSVQWKIVPLSHCAKLIYTEGTNDPPGGSRGGPGKVGANQQPKRSAVYNLGHPLTDASKALMAWVALLHKVVQHATVRLHQGVESGLLDTPPRDLPFSMSPNKIGDLALGRLSGKDDAAWSQVIHCMASNLLWLSECASTYVLQTTALQASAPAPPPPP